MRIDLLKQLLQVQTVSRLEVQMSNFLVAHCRAEGYRAWKDNMGNVYVVKEGTVRPAWYPLVCAHIDTVHMPRQVRITEANDRLGGMNDATGQSCGIGADCKTGVFACLEILKGLDTGKAIFFVMEEIGCLGAIGAEATFFIDVGYCIEFDAPGRGIMSYRSNGVRLFDNQGSFIEKALPVLDAHQVAWQNHPYTDVHIVAPRFDLSCLNVSSGYYNWHSDQEFAYLPDVAESIQLGAALVRALGYAHYPRLLTAAKPLRTVTDFALDPLVHRVV